MKLRKISIEPDNPITHEIFCVELPTDEFLEVLIMKFAGTYGAGSEGNGDAEYMVAVTRGAISFTDPVGVIFDFTGLRYEWGDLMGKVFSSAADQWNEELPMAIVVSELCEGAIRSLLIEDLMLEDLSLVHHDLEGALAYIDRTRNAGKAIT